MVRVRDGRDRGQRLHCKLDGVVVELRPGDLSLSGVFLPGTTQLEVDREVELELCSPIGELQLEALVVQVVPPQQARREGRDAGAGLLFLNLGDDQRAFIGLSLDALLRSGRSKKPEHERTGRPLAPRSEERERSGRSPRPQAPEPEAIIRRSAPQAATAPSMPKPVTVSARPEQPPSVAAAAAVQKPVTVSARPEQPAPVASAPPRAASPPPRIVPRPDPGPTPAQQKLLRELEQLMQSLSGKTPWAVLGLEPSAGLAAAKQAFLGFSKRYHPHLYARHDRPELSRAATELFIAYRKAFAAIEALPIPEVAERAAPRSAPSEAEAPAADEPALRATKTPTLPTATQAQRASEESARPLTIPPPPSAAAAAVKTSIAPQSPSKRAAPPSEAPVQKSVHSSTVRPKPVSSPPPAATRSSYSSQPPPPAKPLRASQPPPVGARRQADAELALAAGMKHLAAARFDAAETELERARALHPGGKAPELWLRICRARKAKAHGRGEEAQRFYAEALEFDPAHREALEHAGARDRRKRTGLIGKFFGPDDK